MVAGEEVKQTAEVDAELRLGVRRHGGEGGGSGGGVEAFNYFGGAGGGRPRRRLRQGCRTSICMLVVILKESAPALLFLPPKRLQLLGADARVTVEFCTYVVGQQPGEFG